MSILKNTSIYTLGNLFPAIAGFLLLPVYSRYLAPEEYAVIASMEVIAYLYGTFVNFNLERASYRFYFDKNDVQWRNNLFFTIHYASIFFTIFWLLVILAFQDLIALVFPSISFWPFFMLVLGRVTLEVVLRTPQQYFQVTEQPLAYVSISIIKLLVSLSFILWFLVVRDAGAQGVLAGSLIGSAFMIPVGIYVGHRYFKGKFDRKILYDALRFTWPFIPSLIIAWVLDLSDRVFLEHYASREQLGLYGMAYKIASAYFILMGAYITAYLPRYYKFANLEDQELASKTLAKDAKINTLLHLSLLMLMFLWCYEGILYFLSGEYSETTDIIRILLVSHFFASLPAVTFTPAILQVKKTKVSMYTAIAAAIINIALNFYLIPKYGMYGASIATVISMVVLFFLLWSVSKKSYLVDFPWRILLLSMVIGSSILGVFIFVLDESSILTSLIKLVVTILILIVLSNYFKKYVVS